MSVKRALVPRKPRDPTAPKMGRPTFHSIRAQQIEVIFDRVAAGETLETVCKDEGTPARASSTPPLSDPPGGGPQAGVMGPKSPAGPWQAQRPDFSRAFERT